VRSILGREDVAAAIQRLAGTQRLVLYDVNGVDAPRRDTPGSVFVRGGAAWWRFIERRRVLDTGEDLNLMVSLRSLNPDERMTLVNWGSAYANSFLLIEPADPALDLTTPEGILDFAQQSHALDADALVRAAYAEWVYWTTEPEGGLTEHAATLDVADPRSTLWGSLWERLSQTFPPSAFLATLTLLNMREQELFTGGREVGRAMMPFLTRLGLPVLYDARHVLAGVRQLVNAGLAWVTDPYDHNRLYRGPFAPLPADLPDERLAVMTR
jgi:hypothetical protein